MTKGNTQELFCDEILNYYCLKAKLSSYLIFVYIHVIDGVFAPSQYGCTHKHYIKRQINIYKKKFSKKIHLSIALAIKYITFGDGQIATKQKANQEDILLTLCKDTLLVILYCRISQSRDLIGLRLPL